MWLQNYIYENAKNPFELSLKKLYVDYRDSYILYQLYGAVDEANEKSNQLE